MKLGIVIPLKSKVVSRNWDLTCENLCCTLNSIVNQSQAGFSVVVVGHEKPDFLSERFNDFDWIHFRVLSELSPPVETEDKSVNQLLYEKDRCSKILAGIQCLRAIDPEVDCWFPLDADDLLHRDFVKEIMISEDYDAIVFEKGFIYYKNSGLFNKINRFSLYCGSSAVVKDWLLPSKIMISESSYKHFIFGEVPHAEMISYLKKLSLNFYIPKRRLVMYCRDNGENISALLGGSSLFYNVKRYIKMKSKAIWFTRGVKSDFGFR